MPTTEGLCYMTEREREERHRKKMNWHRRLRERACIHASAICQLCGSETELRDGVIHHNEYPMAWWDSDDVEEVMDLGICAWWCKKCHRDHHIAHSLEEAMQPGKTGGVCHFCGQLKYDGGWNRARCLGLNYYLCKKCHKAKKHKEGGEG